MLTKLKLWAIAVAGGMSPAGAMWPRLYPELVVLQLIPLIARQACVREEPLRAFLVGVFDTATIEAMRDIHGVLVVPLCSTANAS